MYEGAPEAFTVAEPLHPPGQDGGVVTTATVGLVPELAMLNDAEPVHPLASVTVTE